MEPLYQLDIKGKAKRELKRVEPDPICREVTMALLELRNDPYPPYNTPIAHYKLKIGGCAGKSSGT